MEIIYGGQAFASAKILRLLAKLQLLEPSLTNLIAQRIYFLDLSQTLNMQERLMLDNILPDVGHVMTTTDETSLGLMVIPRIGTISPWSSKATDILQNCGADKIERMESGVCYQLTFTSKPHNLDNLRQQFAKALHDPMTQSVINSLEEAEALFAEHEPKPTRVVDVLNLGEQALAKANGDWGLALSKDEIEYLVASYEELARDPSDAELMMFAQANSEHCRHKIFNADWRIDQQIKQQSLFSMIRNTHNKNPNGVLSAYKDNAAVITGHVGKRMVVKPESKMYYYEEEPIHFVAKVETHNHPTAIAPFPGAATGSGGEIRDEGATGIGAKPKAGLVGFSVSNLKIPGLMQPWEIDYGKPTHMASALDIMIEAPIGASRFNNEFGRPNICGYFRSFEQTINEDNHTQVRGYHKPIMIAGGLGNIRESHIAKKDLPVGAQIIVLGGPAMLIGLGGGAASSMAAGQSNEQLDFASVQRGNPEMQRRAQEVIDACWMLGDANPILSIHDVGAGGLANAVPEIIHASERGGRIELRTIPNDEPGMSPMEIWCNESQERYVLAINEADVARFVAIAERERCPYAILGEVTEEQDLIVGDGQFDNSPVNIPMELLFGKPPKMLREYAHKPSTKTEFNTADIDPEQALARVLQQPTVACKNFLITIGDRSVGGLVARDQMVGPWQVPVADCGVTAIGFQNNEGEAMAMGERTPIAVLHHKASARMAIGEAITNIAAARIDAIEKIILSANWMAACNHPGEDAGLFDAVEAVGMELCPALGINIPVGKDSLSMRTVWQDNEEQKSVVSPLSLIVSAFAPVKNIHQTLTPQLHTDAGDTDLILIDLGRGQNRLGASILAQVYQQMGHHPADLDDPQLLKAFFAAIQKLNQDHKLLAYHDRSDGGLIITLCEMAFAGRAGVKVLLDDLGDDPIASLFNEELGAVIQVRHQDTEEVLSLLREYDLAHYSYVIGSVNESQQITCYFAGKKIIDAKRSELQQLWAKTSYHMQRLRDNPECADQEFNAISDDNDRGLYLDLSFSLKEFNNLKINFDKRPMVAILREQGVNGHVEMAAAFRDAGFCSHDVHMSDIIEGRVSLKSFIGLAACGGFSYGDVLGAGQGWAKTILFNQRAYDEFAEFFMDPNTFTLGVCNGCQMLAHLKSIIPGSGHWPEFIDNQSEQFEARLAQVEIPSSPSLFFTDMAGSQIPVVISHGEGRVKWANSDDIQAAQKQSLICMRYVDSTGNATENIQPIPMAAPVA